MSSDKVVTGAVESVPCPFCGKGNDFRDLEQQQLLDTGHEVGCDFCGNIMEVAAIRTAKVISVRQLAKRAPAGRQIPPQQRPGLVGAVKKFLKP